MEIKSPQPHLTSDLNMAVTSTLSTQQQAAKNKTARLPHEKQIDF